jgi:nucleotide-binding universal stress UspA family protein
MKILLPVDGSDVSLQAVRVALGMVRDGLQASMVLANVQEPATLYEMVVSGDTDAIARASAEAGMHTLAAAEALLKAADIAYECEVAAGDPAHTIVDILERFACDLVIMGARGKSTLRSALLGSVSNEVLHAAGVPVMIVKAANGEDTDTDENADAVVS